ncbi:MAG: cytochrome c oxidase subunit 3 [Planctomycetes bacterium]|nr:cytochrome c oxidase subunit 3 [Planctomycetota bacterium]
MSTDSSSVLAHHYDSMEQQQGAARLGMWMFLVTEVLFFGGIFVAYTAYRIWYPEAFLAASSKLNVLIAGINSLLLLTSSLTITFAIHAAHEGKQEALRRWLLVTVALAVAFLGFKTREYYNDYHEHLIPGKLFNSVPEGETHSPAYDFEHNEKVNPKHVQLFFLFYYCMTGLHVLHMIVGVGLILWLYMLAKRNYFHHPDRYVYVEVTSLYWHFVDMMWFFLVAILYAAGPRTHWHWHL